MWSNSSCLSTEVEERQAAHAIAANGQMVFVKSHFLLSVGKDGNGTAPASLEDTEVDVTTPAPLEDTEVDVTAPASLEDTVVVSYDTNHTLTE